MKIGDHINKLGGGPNTRAYLRDRPFVDSPEAAADRAAAREAMARADAGEITDSSEFLYALRREREEQRNPHPNARRLVESRSAAEAFEAQERALAAGEILDAGQGQDSSEPLRERVWKEVG